ncbi:MAG: hypothetical protein M3I41_08405 [Actinomyces graevenitzii]|uniref:GIY-YIG nuclease family protein n=1 Tax=Actinomyces graevenitzii TaxID=55565 RepID=A0A9E7ALT6_9ACTO|nr:MAG: hypothetical protein M3I41_08405 [Actinomyces graevenitzii]
MSKPGIYMMLGDPTDKKPEVYIGQAKRRKNGNGTTHLIIEHIDRGEHLFCQWAIMLVDDAHKFGPTELTNLENTFTLAAQEAGLTRVRNGCEPSNSELTLATRLRLDKVVETTRLMLGALGIYIFDPHERHRACLAREVRRADLRRPHHRRPRVHILQHCRHLRGQLQPQR